MSTSATIFVPVVEAPARVGKRTNLKTILILGGGPIVIGQACEFDYSRTQAWKALKEEWYEVILINSNPATIMTDPDVADRTYVIPMTPKLVKQVQVQRFQAKIANRTKAIGCLCNKPQFQSD